MRDFRSILNIIGILLCIEAIAMIIPMIYDIAYNNEDWKQFLFSSLTRPFCSSALHINMGFELIALSLETFMYSGEASLIASKVKFCLEDNFLRILL